MTITITMQDKTITIEIPEIEGQDVKVSDNTPTEKSSAPGAGIVPNNSFKALPSRRQVAPWRDGVEEILMHDSPDFYSLRNSNAFSSFFAGKHMIVVSADGEWNGGIVKGWAALCDKFMAGNVRFKVIDKAGHMLVIGEDANGKHNKYDVKILTYQGVQEALAVPECPERNYNLWRSVGLSRIPRLAENLLAA